MASKCDGVKENRVRILTARSPAEMERLRPAWERLYASGHYTRFQSFSWNHLAARVFAHREWPNIVFGENDAGAAIIPAVLTENGRRLGFLGEALFDYRDVLFEGDAHVLECAWEELAALRLPFSLVALRGKKTWPLWRDFEPQLLCDAPGVRLDDCNAEQFAAAHCRLGRQIRRLQRQGCRLEHRSGSASELLAWIYRQKAAQVPANSTNLFADQLRIHFVMSAASLDPDSWEIHSLERDAQVVAALVTFLDGDTRRFYTVYYDHRWGKYSPGTALLYEVTRLSLASRLNCDYMTGEQPHKTRLATSRVPLYRVDLSSDQLRRAVNPEIAVQPAA